MLKEFIIQSPKAKSHNTGAANGYDKSHPHLWSVKDKWGSQCILISKRDDYKQFSQITIDVDQIGLSNSYIDRSPAKNLNARITTPAVPPGVIDSDVILLIGTIDSGNNKTLVNGTIFYFNPKLKNLQDSSLRAAFRDGAAITVTTHLKAYNFNAGHTYIFENLCDVTLAQNRIIATDARMPKP